MLSKKLIFLTFMQTLLALFVLFVGWLFLQVITPSFGEVVLGLFVFVLIVVLIVKSKRPQLYMTLLLSFLAIVAILMLFVIVALGSMAH